MNTAKPLARTLTSTVSSKGQTTIPKQLRDEFDLDQGSTIIWQVDRNHETGAVVMIMLKTERRRGFMSQLGVATLPDGMRADELLEDCLDRDPELRTGPGARVMTLEAFLRHE